jgi:hypothetical protein
MLYSVGHTERNQLQGKAEIYRWPTDSCVPQPGIFACSVAARGCEIKWDKYISTSVPNQ